jgi:hypothetical protein
LGINLGLVNVNLYGDISDAPNAVNGQVKDASTLSVPIGVLGLTGSATQFLEFTTDGTNANKRTIAANTAVTVKLTLPKELLGLLSNFEIGSFTNLHAVSGSKPLVGYGNDPGYDATKTPIYTAANIAGVIGGGGEIEITVTPTQAFNGIYVKIAGAVVSTALSMKVFHAYIMEPTTNINCDEAIDILSGVKPTPLGGILNLTGSVADPFYAIDTDADSYALMDVGLNVLSRVYLTPIFQKPSQQGDSVRIVFDDPGGALLNLGLLKGFVIQPYLGDLKAGSAFEETNSFLNLKILPGPGGKQIMTFAVSEKYDRLEITMGGVADLLGRLRIYDIKRKLAKPRTLIDPLAEDKREICEGESATFEVKNPQDCTEYKWYDAESGGNLLHTGTTYTPTGLTAGDYSYYVQASRTYCVTGVSERLKVKLKVKPYAVVNPIAGVNELCAGASTVLTNSNPSGTWSTADAAIATVDATGKVVAVAAGTVVIRYTVADDASYCGKKVDFTLTVNPLPNLTLDADPGVCERINHLTLPYSNPVNSPDSYSISWSGTASSFPAVNNQALPANEITLNIPGNAAVGVYSGTLTIKNAKGCERAIPFSFRVKLIPHKPIVSIN